MSSKLKSVAAIFLLGLFLYPQVQKGFHDFEHRNDSHCLTVTEKHIHVLEHVCSICDFSITGNVPGIFNDPYIFLEVISIHFSEVFVPHTISVFWKSLPPRAPPIA